MTTKIAHFYKQYFYTALRQLLWAMKYFWSSSNKAISLTTSEFSKQFCFVFFLAELVKFCQVARITEIFEKQKLSRI